MSPSFRHPRAGAGQFLTAHPKDLEKGSGKWPFRYEHRRHCHPGVDCTGSMNARTDDYLCQMGSAKGSEKKGATKGRIHKFFLGLPGLRGQTKKLPLCLRVFVVQGLYAFCDSLLREDGRRALFSTIFPPSIP